MGAYRVAGGAVGEVCINNGDDAHLLVEVVQCNVRVRRLGRRHLGVQDANGEEKVVRIVGENEVGALPRAGQTKRVNHI